MTEAIARAVAMLQEADGLLVTAGAGMGVDSGLPDFRGPQGFWSAYPALARGGIRFEAIASPAAFRADPHLAWGFYGHRLALYRDTVPHRGFGILRDLWQGLRHGLFVVTSNVDGQFQAAGFDPERIDEVHGSIHHLQCMTHDCPAGIWDAGGLRPEVDTAECRWRGELPRCPACNGLARPNILMFADWEWRQEREAAQARRLAGWLQQTRRTAVIEVGAGTSVPTIRMLGDRFERLIRINPREPGTVRTSAVSLPMGGLAGLEAIAQALGLPPRRVPD